MMMGIPFLVILFTVPDVGLSHAPRGAYVVAATFALALHVYLFNAWAGQPFDRHDRHKKHWHTVDGTLSREPVLVLSVVSLVVSATTFLAISWLPFLCCVAIALLWMAYAHPSVALKRITLVPTLIHLVAGVLTALLAQGSFGRFDSAGVLIGAYFGLVLAGGHLVHELLDLDADRDSGFRTSAIRFGRGPVFLVSALLFTASTVLFGGLTWVGAVPLGALGGPLFVYPFYLYWWVGAYRAGLTHEAVYRFRSRYRAAYIVAGIGMALAAV